MAALDRNTILSLLKDPKSIDLHNLALSKMKKIRVDSTVQHDLLADRARQKNIKNSDELFQKLNEFEKNGVMDLWIKKFNKNKYQQKLQESIEISQDILLENGRLKLVLDKEKIVEEMGMGAATSAAGMTSVGMGPAATMAGSPSKNSHITTKSPCVNDCDKTHQDPGAEA